MPIDADQLIDAIRQAMPGNAEIQIAADLAHIKFGVAWKLNNDPTRPHKMSQTIAIEVTQEAALDFENASAADQINSYSRVARFIAAKLQNFDPNHDTQRFEPPPVEKWRVTSGVLLG